MKPIKIILEPRNTESWINPAFIAVFSHGDSGFRSYTRVLLMDGSEMSVKGTPNELIDALARNEKND